jgi:hypothetical protein
MKRFPLALVVWVLLCAVASAAWTEKYVSVAGAGAHDGTSEANAWTLTEAVAVAHADGTRINIKAGTYANTTTTQTFAEAGTTTGAIWWRGYNTTIGDIDADNSLAKPEITFTTGQFAVSGAFQWFHNLNISGACTTAGGQVNCTGADCRFRRCRFTNTAANAASSAFATSTGSRSKVFACWATCTTSANVYSITTAGTTLIGCHAEGGSLGFFTSSDTSFMFCVADGQASHGMQLQSTAGSNVINCSIYNSGGNGIFVNSAANSCLIANCVIDTTGNDAIEAVSSSSNVTISNCAIRGWTGARLSNIFESTEFDATTESAIPFVNAPLDDFRLKAAATSRETGFPGSFENESATTGFVDRGAVQAEDEAGGGSVDPIGHVAEWGDKQDTDQTDYFEFTTLSQAAVPATITGITTGATDAVAIYNLSTSTEITAADTIDLDFDSRTGTHRVTVNFGSASFTDGSYVAMLIDADATCDSKAITGRPIATFTVGQYSSTGDVEAEIDDRLPSSTATTQITEIFNNDGTGGDMDLSTLSVTGGATIANSSGTALTLSSTGGNGHGLIATADGLGEGIKGIGGATGNGLEITGGSSSGSGLVVTGSATSPGATFTSGIGATGNAIEFVAASTNGNGVSMAGSGSGFGLTVTRGASITHAAGTALALQGGTAQPAMTVTAGSGGASALILTASGSGSALWAIGGPSGDGFLLDGGATGDDLNFAGDDVTIPWNAAWDAEAQSEANDAIIANGLGTIRSGTAQAGAASTITLDASASSVTDFYKNRLIVLTANTGSPQVRRIVAYNGTTKVARVHEPWAAGSTPDNTTTFAILPMGQ